MYTAKLINKEEKTNELVVTIEYSNGVDSFQEIMTTNGSFRTIEQLKRMVEDKIGRLNSQAEISNVLTVGEDIPAPIIEEIIKTEDEIAFDTFMSSYNKLSKVNDLIRVGVLTGDENSVTTLISNVKSLFKVEYFDKI